jgi:ABC-type sugar transport system substrate-binding protein
MHSGDSRIEGTIADGTDGSLSRGELLAGAGTVGLGFGVSSLLGPAQALAGTRATQRGAAKGKYYWIAHDSATNSYWATVLHGTQFVSKQLGADVVYQGPQKYDPTKQADLVTAAVNAGAAGIVTTAASAKAMERPAKLATQKGIPLIFSDTPPPPDWAPKFIDGSPFGFVGYDIAEAARRVAAKVAPLLPKGATVVVINHEPGNQILVTKTKGYITGLASVHPKVYQLAVGSETTRAIEILRGFYSRHKDLKAIFGLGGVGLHVALGFLKEANVSPQKIRVAGSDVDTFTLNAIAKGDEVATIGLPSLLLGMLPVVLLYYWNEYALTPQTYLTVGDTVAKDNVEAYKKLAVKHLR